MFLKYKPYDNPKKVPSPFIGQPVRFDKSDFWEEEGEYICSDDRVSSVSINYASPLKFGNVCLNLKDGKKVYGNVFFEKELIDALDLITDSL